MRRELFPNTVSEVVSLPYTTCEQLGRTVAPDGLTTLIGNVSKDGNWAWMANGTYLEVVSTQNGSRLAAWCFGAAIKDSVVSVSCVEELQHASGPKLIVGLDYGCQGGCFCVFDIKTSKVIRAYQTKYKVTVLEVISLSNSTQSVAQVLHSEVHCMFGVVAVGTSGGHVLLVDINLEDDTFSDELNPDQLIISQESGHSNSLPNSHCNCISLNGDLQGYRGQYHYRSPDDSVLISFYSDDVNVTSVSYLPQLGCLAVGYNFGGFQLWNLSTLALDYTSAVTSDASSVIKFAFQEPENDPRKFCYLWVVRGTPNVVKHDTVTTISLHSLTYSSKEWVQSVGHYYQTLQSCSFRFMYDFNMGLYLPNGEVTTSRLIACSTVPFIHPDVEDIYRDDGLANPTPSLSLIMFAWESFPLDPKAKSECYLGIFDLNQWYQAQMPSSVNLAGLEQCPYFGFFSLESIMEKASPDFLLDVRILPNTISQFQMVGSAEQQFYPSSLAFKICCLIETGVIWASYLGLQRQVLTDLRATGPSAMLDPKEAFHILTYCGLVRKTGDTPPPSSNYLTSQREAILSVALENNLLDFIGSCITVWANREYSHAGCTLRFVLEWAWKKAAAIKNASDKLGIPLYNCCGLQLDTTSVKLLHHYGSQFQSLTTIFQMLSNQMIPTTEQGQRELEARMNIVSLVNVHHQLVLWFHESRLLPEVNEGEEYNNGEIAYPGSALAQIYSHRRSELQRINSSIRETDLLLIDGIISHIGDSITSLWQKDGGNGLFPPPSFYALLNMYLLDGMMLSTKHCIVNYLFLDLAAFLPEDKYANVIDQLARFPASISLSPSLTKLTLGFWLLDHKDFEGAINVLLDPMINGTDILPWQHTQIIKAFLYQGESVKALKYIKIRCPSFSTADDIKLHLTVLLANKMIAEAFQYQRSCRDQATADDLLHHFFLGCQQTKMLNELMKLPLNTLEEEALINFLNTSNEPNAQELLLIYYVQRGRFVQAMTLNEHLKPRLMNEGDPYARERSTIRNIIIDGYTSVLPKVQQKLALESEFHWHPGKSSQIKVINPLPLTAVVKPSHIEVISQSTLIKAVMEKTTEIWQNWPPEGFTPLHNSTYAKSGLSATENMPFICTPVLPRVRNNSVSEMIFPTMVSKDTDIGFPDMCSDFLGSPSKKSRFTEMSPAKRRFSKHLSADAMSLLQTPPLRRKTPTKSVLSGVNSLITPQSILKVRRIIQRSTSPPQMVESRISKGTSPTVSQPQTVVDTQLPDSTSENYDNLPKQLRFELPHSRSTSPENQENSVFISPMQVSDNSFILNGSSSPEKKLNEISTIATSSQSTLENRFSESPAPATNGRPHPDRSFTESPILKLAQPFTAEESDSSFASQVVSLTPSPRRPLHSSDEETSSVKKADKEEIFSKVSFLQEALKERDTREDNKPTSESKSTSLFQFGSRGESKTYSPEDTCRSRSQEESNLLLSDVTLKSRDESKSYSLDVTLKSHEDSKSLSPHITLKSKEESKSLSSDAVQSATPKQELLLRTSLSKSSTVEIKVQSVATEEDEIQHPLEKNSSLVEDASKENKTEQSFNTSTSSSETLHSAVDVEVDFKREQENILETFSMKSGDDVMCLTLESSTSSYSTIEEDRVTSISPSTNLITIEKESETSNSSSSKLITISKSNVPDHSVNESVIPENISTAITMDTASVPSQESFVSADAMNRLSPLPPEFLPCSRKSPEKKLSDSPPLLLAEEEYSTTKKSVVLYSTSSDILEDDIPDLTRDIEEVAEETEVMEQEEIDEDAPVLEMEQDSEHLELSIEESSPHLNQEDKNRILHFDSEVNHSAPSFEVVTVDESSVETKTENLGNTGNFESSKLELSEKSPSTSPKGKGKIKSPSTSLKLKVKKSLSLSPKLESTEKLPPMLPESDLKEKSVSLSPKFETKEGSDSLSSKLQVEDKSPPVSSKTNILVESEKSLSTEDGVSVEERQMHLRTSPPDTLSTVQKQKKEPATPVHGMRLRSRETSQEKLKDIVGLTPVSLRKLQYSPTLAEEKQEERVIEMRDSKSSLPEKGAGDVQEITEAESFSTTEMSQTSTPISKSSRKLKPKTKSPSRQKTVLIPVTPALKTKSPKQKDSQESSSKSSDTTPIYNTRLRSQTNTVDLPAMEVEPKEVDPVIKTPKSRTRSTRIQSRITSTKKAEPEVKKEKETESRIEFKLSEPTIIAKENFENEPSTPTTVKSFVFSPPLTRSRSRRGKRPSDPDTTLDTTLSLDSKTTEEKKKSNKKKITTKKKNTKSDKDLEETLGSDNPINLLSPFPVKPPSPSLVVSRSYQSSRSARHSMSLRNQSMIGQTRHKAQLW